MINHSLDAVFQHGDVEVDQQPDSEIEKSQMREQLSLVDRMKRVFALQLDDYCAVDHQIRSKPQSSLTPS